jgi:hypothetical protein
MITRPTTEQILLDCCRELMESVLPALSDENDQVRVIMIDTVLRNAAVRAAHETAWMRDEIDEIGAYAEQVAGLTTGSPALAAAQAALAGAPGQSLHLDDVVETYCRAGEVLSVALELVMARRDADLVSQGEQILEARIAREYEVLGGWSPAGR